MYDSAKDANIRNESEAKTLRIRNYPREWSARRRRDQIRKSDLQKSLQQQTADQKLPPATSRRRASRRLCLETSESQRLRSFPAEPELHSLTFNLRANVLYPQAAPAGAWVLAGPWLKVEEERASLYVLGPGRGGVVTTVEFRRSFDEASKLCNAAAS
ncbi:hypothetical protein NM688_g1880 [Phlebia brevispora]|uniref:Uncharacterized protein n=1 Tax=Phlebia brevispora TaxID=194682 RepID=A0ACC1TAJ8_9APHY|nr:hypothetical protein NM688_g1880 [Phlebia brevispora]